MRKFFYSDIDNGDLERLRLIIETRAKIKEVHKSTQKRGDTETKGYLKFMETQSTGTLNNVWLEFLHQISIPSEIFDLSEREVNKVSFYRQFDKEKFKRAYIEKYGTTADQAAGEE